jgi:hypothetical protein
MFANNSPESKVLWLSTALCLTFVVNQYLWLFSHTYISSIVVGLLILTILFFTIRSAKQSPEIIFMLLIVCFLGIMTLGSATSAWDARSIWLFHAKRIYFDNNLLAQLDNYGAFSHNDYPVLLPALSATLAKIVGHWNEVFPKVSNVLFILPPLVVIGVTFTPLRYTVFFVASLFFIAGRLLTNGFMDGILSLYIVASLILLAILFFGWKENLKISRGVLLAAAIGHLAVLVGIKNEGTMAALIMLFCLLISLAIDKKRIEIRKILLIFLPAFMISGIWLLLCYQYGVGNDVATKGNFISTLAGRLMDAFSIHSVASALYYQKWIAFLPLCLFLIYFFQKNETAFKTASFLLRFGLLYSFSLFFIYLGTPHDLHWHLATSAKRTALPFFLTFMTCFLILFTEYASKNNNNKK